ncbi:hypothetical protein E3V97_04345 [Pedobacter alluvionis]|uniref:Uncharacterized protein n=1 Tax=Pedobacter alluvionis TaxID=475253 RepID=A0ABY2HTL3_9SPHI|nr:hypothetical protein E3V97_04345 [Pedobacter alluvionis]
MSEWHCQISPFNVSTFLSFYNSLIPSFSHSIILSFSHSIISLSYHTSISNKNLRCTFVL